MRQDLIGNFLLRLAALFGDSTDHATLIRLQALCASAPRRRRQLRRCFVHGLLAGSVKGS